jgi:hypothetical protein
MWSNGWLARPANLNERHGRVVLLSGRKAGVEGCLRRRCIVRVFDFGCRRNWLDVGFTIWLGAAVRLLGGGAVDVDATQWHNWAVEWTPKGITAYVDGNPWWHTDDTGVLPPGPMHLCVQLDWFPTSDGAVRPSEMQVDWVRQYPLDAASPTAASPTAAPTADNSVVRDVVRRTFGW